VPGRSGRAGEWEGHGRTGRRNGARIFAVDENGGHRIDALRWSSEGHPVAYVFISHSSRDDEFANHLAEDIKELGHNVFLDEWAIKVGDRITAKVSAAVADADYIVIVLSPSSTASGWVEREWQARHGDEIRSGKTIILPVLIADCDIPPLLQDKRYADFRTNYSIGLVNLMAAITPDLKDETALTINRPPEEKAISGLLARVSDPASRLTQCLQDVLALSRSIGDANLEQFCRQELYGWKPERSTIDKDSAPSYRLVEVFVAPRARINLQYVGFNGNASAAFDFMRRTPDEYFLRSFFVHQPVPEMEAKPTADPWATLITFEMDRRMFYDNVEPSAPPVVVYAQADLWFKVLAGIRTELSRRLLDLLPSIGA
jgi:hypothetical protein